MRLTDGQLDLDGAEYRHTPKPKKPMHIIAAERAAFRAALAAGPATESEICSRLQGVCDTGTVRVRLKEARLNGEVRNIGRQQKLGGGWDTLWALR